MKFIRTLKAWVCSMLPDGSETRSFRSDNTPEIKTQGLSDAWSLTDPEFISKIKDIINSVDVKKIKYLMDTIEVGNDGYINIKINMKIKKEIK